MEKVRPVKLLFLPRACADIAAIHEFIAQHSPRAAVAVAAQIHLTSQLLARYPALGRKTDIADVRVLPTSRYPYLVYHRVQHDELVIIHVRHASRDIPATDAL
jgi:plasmid stabilization system protein ParE